MRACITSEKKSLQRIKNLELAGTVLLLKGPIVKTYVNFLSVDP